MVITCLSRRYIKTWILSNNFYKQLWLIPRIKLTFINRELPFIISKKQVLTQLCFTIIVNKLQGQFFNFISINLRILVFTYKQLYVALLRVTDIGGLSLLLPQEDSAATTNIIYLEVLLPDSMAAVVAVAAVGQQQGNSGNSKAVAGQQYGSTALGQLIRIFHWLAYYQRIGHFALRQQE